MRVITLEIAAGVMAFARMAAPALSRSSMAFAPRPSARWLLRLGAHAAWIAPLAILCVLGPIVARACVLSTYNPLGRDQGIFQYIASAVLHGAKDYKDVRDVNGPLIHMLHIGFVSLVGTDERAFHIVDRGISLGVFALTSGLLAYGANGRRRLTRGLWAGAGSIYLFAQYIHYLYWDWAQRESFCDWFALLGVGLGIYLHERKASRSSEVLWGLTMALLVLPAFGKPTFAPFPLVCGAIFLATSAPVARTRRLVAFTLGGFGGALLPVGYIVLFGDLRAFVTIYLVDAPRLYAFIWPHTVREVFELPWIHSAVTHGVVSSGVLLFALAFGLIPRRFFAVAVLPWLGLFSLFIQRKGFPYHLHPVSAGAALCELTLVMAACNGIAREARVHYAGNARWLRISRIGLQRVVLGLGLTFGLPVGLFFARQAMNSSPPVVMEILEREGQTRAMREGPAFLAHFQMQGFQPWQQRLAARYVDEVTRDGAPVEAYGMDPYVMFLADRRQVSPYIYAYDLDVEAAFYGAQETLPRAKGEVACARIVAMGNEHARILLESIARTPPEAWFLLDAAPLTSYATAREDLGNTRPEVARVLSMYYTEMRNYEGVHVYMRRDLTKRIYASEP